MAPAKGEQDEDPIGGPREVRGPVAGAPAASTIAAAVHSDDELLGAPERADEERHHQRNQTAGAFHQPTGPAGAEVGAAGDLRAGDAVELLGEDGHEAQSDEPDHAELIGGDAEALQRDEQQIAAVGECSWWC